MINIELIENGTVIDHIPAGRALTVLKILGITGKEGYRVAVVMNVESRRMGRKDIVKVEGRELEPEEVNKVALIAPTATINIIRDYVVVKKRRVELPETVVGLIKCPNPTCISRKKGEPVESKFKIVSREPLRLQCEYCGTIISGEDIEGLML